MHKYRENAGQTIGFPVKNIFSNAQNFFYGKLQIMPEK